MQSSDAVRCVGEQEAAIAWVTPDTDGAVSDAAFDPGRRNLQAFCDFIDGQPSRDAPGARCHSVLRQAMALSDELDGPRRNIAATDGAMPLLGENVGDCGIIDTLPHQFKQTSLHLG